MSDQKMRVWVVVSNAWNGECDDVSVSKVFASEASAQAYCDENNAKKISAYSTEYEIAGCFDVEA